MILSVNRTGFNRITNYTAIHGEYHTSPVKNETKDNKVSEKYLDNLAMINAPAVKKVDDKKAENKPYKNNLRIYSKKNCIINLKT